MIDGLRTVNVKAEDLDANNSITGQDGAIYSAGVGSPITYGAIVQAGRAGPLVAATGSIVFGRQFSDQSFIVTVTGIGSHAVIPTVVSGTTTYTISGITFNGQSGTNLKYNWVAVGI